MTDYERALQRYKRRGGWNRLRYWMARWLRRWANVVDPDI